MKELASHWLPHLLDYIFKSSYFTLACRLSKLCGEALRGKTPEEGRSGLAALREHHNAEAALGYLQLQLHCFELLLGVHGFKKALLSSAVLFRMVSRIFW